MDFGDAIQLMKNGESAARQGWSGGVFLRLQKPDDHSKMTGPYIYFQRGEMDPYCIPWVPSQEDMLATDWIQLGAVG